jgi:uncharacterized protein (TIGR03435 family)
MIWREGVFQKGNLMLKLGVMAALLLSACGIIAQSPAPRQNFDAFEVASVKPVDPNLQAGRYITMQGPHRFVANGYTLKLLIAAAYSLNSRTISGGPVWIESDHFDILAITPGDVRPTHDEQMAMLRNLLAERFKLTFHREQKEFSIYELKVGKNGPKLKASTAAPDDPAALVSTVFPDHILLPARNTTMGEFAVLMQRAILDRPVVDKTGLSGKYDFDLEWAPDESQFGGDAPRPPADAAAAPLFTAIQEQLGLKFEPTRGPVAALVIDKVLRPSAN